MALILTSMALGLLPAWRGSLAGIIVCSWAVALVMAASLVSGHGPIESLAASIALVILGFNAGVAMGFGLHYRAGLQPARI